MPDWLARPNHFSLESFQCKLIHFSNLRVFSLYVLNESKKTFMVPCFLDTNIDRFLKRKKRTVSPKRFRLAYQLLDTQKYQIVTQKT